MCNLSQKPVAFYNTDLIQLINKATIGTVITEASEETSIIFAVYISSYSYFCARSTKNRTSVIHQKKQAMVPWGTGDPISSGDLNTLVFLTEKPPPLSVSIGGGSMSPNDSMIC